MKTGAGARADAGAAADRRRLADRARRPMRGRRRRRAARARAPLPSRCWPASCSTPAKTRWRHADGVAAILQAIGAAPSMRAAAYLVYAGDYLQRPEEVVGKAFGAVLRQPGDATRASWCRSSARRARRRSRREQRAPADRARAQDAAGLLARPARGAAAPGLAPADAALVRRQQAAPARRRWRASRCRCSRRWPTAWASGRSSGSWRTWPSASCSPTTTSAWPRCWTRSAPSARRRWSGARRQLADELARARACAAEVQGRPKHLYSIWKKMQGKGLDFDQVFDLRALRVIVADVPACYAALARVHERLRAGAGRVRRLHRPAQAQRLPVAAHRGAATTTARPLEVQIRTRAMHEHAEHGVAAHWAYKEAGAQGLCRRQRRRATSRNAWPRRARPCCASCWPGSATSPSARRARRPRAACSTTASTSSRRRPPSIELPAGATPVDFAYSLHTDLGHRCRGARVDGAMVPLNTPLRNGQTVEVIAAKEGGPSLRLAQRRAGLPAEPARARQGARLVQRAGAGADHRARPRAGRKAAAARRPHGAEAATTWPSSWASSSADALFEVVGKDEFSLRNIENLLRPAEPAPTADELIALRQPRATATATKGGVLVVGVESLLTTLARCCRPAPPDAIGGFVTRGKGVAIHRADCSNFRHMAQRAPERRDRRGLGRAGAATRPPSTRWTWWSRPTTARACCATSPRCSPRRR